ncbi:Uncharacterized protein LOK49_LG11G01480 [Camellia lanceoleosa]|uniref:Uncharacterized protein n=1 Tax=Camellia lanceoleosa TaxID=1840588 RepID=A0ACC0G2Z6_9ERIC|nr:Uncharacterized protein LOK49_LG11G01480 [Camellia lanceoleosa]
MVIDQLVMDKTADWVKLYGLPLKCSMKEVGFRLGKAIGEVIKVDIDILMPRNIQSLCIRVWVATDQPLISGFYLQFKDGHHQWISCSYEHVYKVCQNCGRVGHTLSGCPLSFAEAKRRIEEHIAEMKRNLGAAVLTQEDQVMYTLRIRAHSHHPDRRTTCIFQEMV